MSAETHEQIIERCAAVADRICAELSAASTAAKRDGQTEEMYRFNTAWHKVRAVSTAIRELKTKQQ